MSARFFRIGGTLLAAAAVFACTEDSSSPNLDTRPSLIEIGSPGVADTGEFELCKYGTKAIFRVIVDGSSQPRFYLGPDECTVVATTADLGVGNHTVTIIEDVIKGTVFDSIIAESLSVNNPTRRRSGPITGLPPRITRTFNGDRGWLVEFYNH